MNKFILVLTGIVFSGLVMAQNGAVTNAILYHKDNDLAKAKQEIDGAVIHEKTKSDPKAWYNKGAIYADISRSHDAGIKNLSPEPLKEAVMAFKKAMELDAAKGEYYKLSENKMKEFFPDVINQGIEDYEAENLENAKAWFELAQEMNPTDTTGYVYGAYAAEALNDDAAMTRYTTKLAGLNYKSPYIYKVQVASEKDPGKKIEIAKKAATDYPEDESILELLGDTYSSQGKNQEALNA